MKVSGPSALTPSGVAAIALDFKVLHPVVVTRLGVFPSGPWPQLQSDVTVKLLQLDQEVPAARFHAAHSESCRTLSNSLCFCRSQW